ncbi:hypothetical protein AA0116_g2770 [Alternaria tenuissima]|nr:hypothetical protein AA0116_g2770 [Alternaria tenuissima]
MSTIIIKANQPVIILPNTHYLVTPEFSISPLHAKALSNIYSSITTDLFTPRDPEWTTSPLSPSICAERGKRHYRRTNVPRYRSSREVNMGAHYTTDSRGLLPGERLQSMGCEKYGAVGRGGVGAWEAECEAMDVLWRTQEKRREEMLRKEMEKKRNVENETVEEDGQRANVIENEYKDTHEIVEMRLRLNAIQMRRIKKRKRKTNVFWVWRSVKKYYEEVRSVEELNLHTTECRVKRWHLARIKRCLHQK